MQLPSSFFRAAAGALEGRRVRVDEIARARAASATCPPAASAPARSERALTLGERDRTLLELDPALGRALLERLEPRAARADARAPRTLGAREPHAVRRRVHRRRRTRGARRAARRARLLGDVPRDLRDLPLPVLAERDPAPSGPLEEPERLLRIDALTTRRTSSTASSSASSPRSTRRSLRPGADAHRDGAARDRRGGARRAPRPRGLTGAPLLWGADRHRDRRRPPRLARARARRRPARTRRARSRSPSARASRDELAQRARARRAARRSRSERRRFRLRGLIDRLDYEPGGAYPGRRLQDRAPAASLPKDGSAQRRPRAPAPALPPRGRAPPRRRPRAGRGRLPRRLAPRRAQADPVQRRGPRGASRRGRAGPRPDPRRDRRRATSIPSRRTRRAATATSRTCATSAACGSASASATTRASGASPRCGRSRERLRPDRPGRPRAHPHRPRHEPVRRGGRRHRQDDRARRRVVEVLRTGHATVDEIAVITFTEAAAAELAARVRQELEDALAAADGRRRARAHPRAR